MAAEAEGLQTRPLDGNYKTCLTRIGLLMEGLGRQNLAFPSAVGLVANSLCPAHQTRTMNICEAADYYGMSFARV